MDWIRICIGIASLPFSFLGFVCCFIGESFRAGRSWYQELAFMLAEVNEIQSISPEDAGELYRKVWPEDFNKSSSQIPAASSEGEAPEPPGRSVSPSENLEVRLPDGC